MVDGWMAVPLSPLAVPGWFHTSVGESVLSLCSAPVNFYPVQRPDEDLHREEENICSYRHHHITAGTSHLAAPDATTQETEKPVGSQSVSDDDLRLSGCGGESQQTFVRVELDFI